MADAVANIYAMTSWPANPEVWIHREEAQFTLNNSTPPATLLRAVPHD